MPRHRQRHPGASDGDRQQRRPRAARRRRKGNVLVLTALLMVMFLLLLGFAIDLGHLALAKTQLQAAADAGALAGASALYAPLESAESDVYQPPLDLSTARAAAAEYVRRNGAALHRFNRGDSPDFTADENQPNDSDGDIVVGRLSNPANRTEQLQLDEQLPNSVLVRARLTRAHANGPVRFLLMSALGYGQVDMTATAVATVEHPSLLPMAVAQKKWDNLRLGGDGDMYAIRKGKVVDEPDGIPELTLFLDRHWKGPRSSPIQFAFVRIGKEYDIGDLQRQIDTGVSADELGQYGGTLYSGLTISGQTNVGGQVDVALNGGAAGEQDFPGVLGKLRVMPLFSQAAGKANEAEITLSKFVAMRVMAVDLSSQLQYLVVQPSVDVREPVHTRLTR